MTLTTSLPAPDVSAVREPGLSRSLSDWLVLTKRNLLHIMRNPEEIAFSTVQPVLFVLLFRYVFGGAIHVGQLRYVDFLMAGIFVQTVAITSIGTAVGLAYDLQRGLVDRFRSLPMSEAAVLGGRAVAGLARNLFVLAVMAAAGVVIGFRPHGNPLRWLAATGLLLLFGFAISWIGVTVAVLMRNLEAVQTAGLTIVFPLTFLSSAFVPTDRMPGWLQAFAEHQPMTNAIEAVRGLILDIGVGSHVWLLLAWSAAILAAFAPLGIWAYRSATAH